MNGAKILLIRHGFSLANNVGWNLQRGLAKILGMLGWDEHVPLDDYGIAQAKETGVFLAKLLKGKRVLFIVSPYQRTRETLENIVGQFDDTTSIDIMVEDSIREMNAGVHFGKTSDELEELYPEEYAERNEVISSLNDKKDKRFIPYIGGEGHQDVRRRVRSFVRRLEKLAKGSDGKPQYDYICVIGHNFINQWIYYWLNNKQKIDVKGIKNGEVIIGNGENAGKSIFAPATFVPKGYVIDFEKYKERAAKKTLSENMNLFGEKSSMWSSLLKDDLIKVKKDGFDLYIPSQNSDSYGCFLVDSVCGHDCVAYDTKSTHSYYILYGSGTFTINGEERTVGCGDVIHIKPNEVFYYSGTMKMIEEIVPNFDEKNFHIVEKVSYDSENNKKKKK